MKNYLNYIKESKEQDELIRFSIEIETFKPLSVFKIDYIKSYIEENFTKFKPTSIKNCLKYLNLDIEKINKVYAFLDNIFSNLDINFLDKYPDSIFYKFNNELVAEYDKESNYFYYDYSKIYQVLTSEFGLSEEKSNELIVCMVEEHLQIRGVIPEEVPL